MAFKFVNKIPDADAIKKELPLPENLAKLKKERDTAINAALTGKTDKLLIIVGPCSAHNEDAVTEYIIRLARLQEKTADRLIIIPRIYTNKPRTTGEGYKGMAHQPNPNKEPDILEGLKAIRRMHLRVLTETGLSSADEMLYPDNFAYLSDVLSYVAIGARSVENQQHRLTVSGLDIPVGMKNPTSGDMSVMFNAIHAGQIPHIINYNSWQVATDGNPYVHGVLRGAVNQFGQNLTNYHYEQLISIIEGYQKQGLKNTSLIIDTNHSNSDKKFYEQPRIALEVMRSRQNNDQIRSVVKGFMIESYLVEGNQKSDGTVYGKSITDPCLGWNDSERLIMDIAEQA